MDKISISVQEYIKSGEYFDDARKWYNFEFIYPITQRSVVSLIFLLLSVSLLIIISNFQNILPIVRPIRYAIESTALKNATIIKVNNILNDPISSIADIMIKNYVTHRESYAYNSLNKQFRFVRNNSSLSVFKQFQNFMTIDNALSPVMRYQKTLNKSIEISSVVYHPNNNVAVRFSSIAKDSAKKIVENILWEANLIFEIDPINITLPNKSPFNFTVTSYKLKLLEDNTNKQTKST